MINTTSEMVTAADAAKEILNPRFLFLEERNNRTWKWIHEFKKTRHHATKHSPNKDCMKQARKFFSLLKLKKKKLSQAFRREGGV